MLQQAHEEHGVAFRLGRKPVRLEGYGRVHAVVLDDGEALRLIWWWWVWGSSRPPIFSGESYSTPTGAFPRIGILRVSEGLYAAGDVVPFFPTGARVTPSRIEHWRLAGQHGRVGPQYGGPPGGVCRDAVLLERAV